MCNTGLPFLVGSALARLLSCFLLARGRFSVGSLWVLLKPFDVMTTSRASGDVFVFSAAVSREIQAGVRKWPPFTKASACCSFCALRCLVMTAATSSYGTRDTALHSSPL